MRILLTSNASYDPPRGGSTRSNLVWLTHLAEAGHACRVVCPSNEDESDSTTQIQPLLEVCAVRQLSRRAAVLSDHIREFRPDWVLVSSEDLSHVLLREARHTAADRLVYLAHTPQWYPFGPASWNPDPEATRIVREARGVVAISHTMAAYIREHCGAEATVIHPPMYGKPPYPRFGSFDSGYVLMVNPSVVKGIAIFLELAKRFPQVSFAGLTGWGTTKRDLAAMAELPNVTILDSVPHIDDVLSRSRLLLMPSLWLEGFGLIAMEAMLRGLPVIASNSGGLAEAMGRTDFVIPIRPVEKFEPVFDETHMPKPVEVAQDIEPWAEALQGLLTNRDLYESEAERARKTAIAFVSTLRASDFESYLVNLTPKSSPMRILLAHNSLYFPSHGGGDKSNRLLMEALAERGHTVRVVTRVENFGDADHNKLVGQLAERGVAIDTSDPSIVRMHLNGVDVHTLTRNSQMRSFFSRQIVEFDPDIILTSTDDPGQLLFDLAIRSSRARVVYLVRATIAVPFGPDSSMPSATKTENLRHADGVVGVSEYVAGYVRQWSGIDAIHVPISLLEPVSEYPNLGRFESPYVSMVNPCAVKGITIFLGLADRLPDVKFAAVPTWGATADDVENLRKRPNIALLEPFDNIDDLLRVTKIMLVPSVWAEARSRIVLESMSRGVPVVAADVGGLHEAVLGVDYLLPVNPIRSYKPTLDTNMVPVAEVPPQNIDPWVQVVDRLVKDQDHWQDLSQRSRNAALDYAANLNVLPFEGFLEELRRRPKKPAPIIAAPLSEDKRKLLALRLKQRAVKKPEWFAGLEDKQPGKMTLFCFPYAGGGTNVYRSWREDLPDVAVIAARLPGRESRLSEAPMVSMKGLVETLGQEILPHLTLPFAFFGHSMGAIIAFELTRWLRSQGYALPQALLVSAARAPQYRRNHKPGPEPTDQQFLEELRRLEGMPREVLENANLMRVALPALRADAKLYREYVYESGEPLAVPIHVYGGFSDPNVSFEHLAAWREQTTASCEISQFDGGHFYLQSSQSALLQKLREALR